MKTIDITILSKKQTYPIHIGTGVVQNISHLLDFEKFSKALIVTDSQIAPLYLDTVKKSISIETHSVICKPGEANKTLQTAEIIWQKMVEVHADRKTVVINLGGGVIGDMGGFAAATYMRGVPFMQIPTTLLAMVDASVGGKTAVDFAGYKNIIGSFAQPKAVVIDTDFLQSLPKRQFVSGFAEIIKHGIIADAEYFEKVTAKKPLDYSEEELINIIARSCEIKRDVVQKDEQEMGLRKILNFGHTAGHAIESVSLKSDTPYLHGEAISIGMAAEAKLSEILGYIGADETKRIEASLSQAGLPVRAERVSKDDVLTALAYDKKGEKGHAKWTLLRGIGDTDFNIHTDPNLYSKAISYVLT